jgi:ubiquitin-protein ligase
MSSARSAASGGGGGAAAAAQKRLMKEYAALRRSPLVGCAAAPVGDDLFHWKALVIGSAPYDFPLRIELRYDAEYPVRAPKAFFETPVLYVGGASYKVDGKLAVCLNIFGNFAHVHTEWRDAAGSGWSPGYTIETILVSLQGLLMDEMLSQVPRDVDMARRAARSFRCAATGHDGGAPATFFPRVAASAAEAEAMAADDRRARGDVDALDAPPCVGADFVCFVNKDVPASKFLGFGVQLENERLKTFSSPCELMSQEAFDVSGVRNSSTNKPFRHWLPVLTPHMPAFDVLEGELRRRLERIAVESGLSGAAGARKPADLPVAALHILTSVLNSLVVEIMNAANNITANDKFVDGYFAVVRLLHALRRRHRDIARVADERIQRFIENPQQRTKAQTPNLGEFLLLLIVSSRFAWADVAEAFVAECDARCVFWYVQGTRFSPGRLGELKDARASGRSQKVFDATATSRCLVCYQARFVALSGLLLGADGPAGEDMFQPVPDSIRDSVKEMYRAVTGMPGWGAYFEWLGMAPRGEAQRDKELVAALEASRRAGYHR